LRSGLWQQLAGLDAIATTLEKFTLQECYNVVRKRRLPSIEIKALKA
jgi:hypothetical protein